MFMPDGSTRGDGADRGHAENWAANGRRMGKRQLRRFLGHEKGYDDAGESDERNREKDVERKKLTDERELCCGDNCQEAPKPGAAAIA